MNIKAGHFAQVENCANLWIYSWIHPKYIVDEKQMQWVQHDWEAVHLWLWHRIQKLFMQHCILQSSVGSDKTPFPLWCSRHAQAASKNICDPNILGMPYMKGIRNSYCFALSIAVWQWWRRLCLMIRLQPFMQSWKECSNYVWIFDSWTITYSDLLFTIGLHLSDISENCK